MTKALRTRLSGPLFIALYGFQTACGGAIDANSVDGAKPTDDGATATRDAGARDATSAGPSNTGVPVVQTPGRGSDAGVDAGADFDAALASAPELLPCIHRGYLFSVDESGGDSGIQGHSEIDERRGTWGGAATSESSFQLNVVTKSSAWVVSFMSDFVHGQYLAPGMYVIADPPGGGARLPSFQVEADGKACPSLPTGTVTIAEFASTYGDQAYVTRLLLGFRMTCGKQGEIHGCVSYGR